MRRIIRLMAVMVFFWGLLVSLSFAGDEMHILMETPAGFFDIETGDIYIVPGKWVREQNDYNKNLSQGQTTTLQQRQRRQRPTLRFTGPNAFKVEDFINDTFHEFGN